MDRVDLTLSSWDLKCTTLPNCNHSIKNDWKTLFFCAMNSFDSPLRPYLFHMMSMMRMTIISISACLCD